MSIEILLGFLVISGFAIWAAYYIWKRTKDNNNEHLFDFIPHLFPTLGILFTFLGIAIGLWNFDGNDIEKSIPELMNGLKTAFIVSIFGVFLLVIFSFWTNIKRKELQEGVLSDETIAIQRLTEVLLSIQQDFQTKDENGNLIKPGNLLRDIYEESRKQSNSLQSFSTDLAITISSGFEEIINNPAGGVVAELRLVRNEIENLGKKLQDPATDMTQNIVKDLQDSLGKMIEDFKNSVSGDTKKEMEDLAKLLGQAGGALLDFPSKLQVMTDNLNENLRAVQEVFKVISNNTILQSNEATIQMKNQIDEMSKILKDRVGDLQKGQEGLIKEQNVNLQFSENLISAFNTSIEKMNGLSLGVTNTTNNLIDTQQNLERVIVAFRAISQDINSATSRFGESQVIFSRYSNEFLENNSETIQEFQKSLETAKKVADDYANKFGIIEKGLQNVFQEINIGLKDYQSAVSTSLASFLGTYTENLTKTAEALEGASSKQEDILEELTEQLSKLNGGRK